VLDELLDARDEHGGQLTDDEVADQIRSLIAAGYDTTSGTLGWAVWALLAHPDETAKLRAELDAVVGGRPLRAEDVSELKALDRFVSEVLRLWGAAVVGARYAATSFEYLGHEVPAGSRVLYSPYVTQRLPELWPDPLAFTPDRWLDDDVAPPYSYVPFGGGPRRCIGFAFALLEIKAALVTVLARTELSLARGHRMRPTGVAAMYPRGGVPVQVGRIVGARV
jgi:cytochrome P450